MTTFFTILGFMRKYPRVLLTGLLLLSLVAGYFWLENRIENRFEQEQREREAQEFIDTTKDVQKAIKDVRKANPDRDPVVSLNRLRDRQTR